MAATAPVLSVVSSGLSFDAQQGVPAELTMPDGSTIRYTAYEGLRYCTNVEDAAYQQMNIYVPHGATANTPVLLRTYIGGYMAAKASKPQPGDATGRALKEGYVVAIPGSRGRNSIQNGAYTGRAPNGLLDLKAAVRYLRKFAEEIPANSERIITDGTSAGGAMSALLGVTGNAREFEPLLEEMGAARERDDVFASVCFCPITDLSHADMAYEWLYNGTDARQNGDKDVLAVSDELKSMYPAYLDSLGLTEESMMDAIRREIIRSAQIAKDAGAEIPDGIGFDFDKPDAFGAPPLNGGAAPQGAPGQGAAKMRRARPKGEYIVRLDMAKYLNYVVSTQPLKTAPAFDTLGVCGQKASGENGEFGNQNGSDANFTPYSAAKNGCEVSHEVAINVHLLNPMEFIGSGMSEVAPCWYIRHGARDRDTAFSVPLCLALKLKKAGRDVDFKLPWNRPHSGDYALDEMFAWIAGILKTE